MNFASWSIRNPIPSILLFLLLAVAGLRAFMTLQVQDLPDLSFPTVSVVAALPGATPGQLETEIARPLENAVAGADGIKHITTTITDGTVRIGAAFDLEKPLSDALIQTKDAVDGIRSDLPSDMLQPTVSAASFADQPIMAYAVRSTRMSEAELSWFIDDTIEKALRTVAGVAEVERLGGVERTVLVTVDPVRLAGLGVTAGEISRALRSVQQQTSGGQAEVGGAVQSLRTVAVVARAEELARLPIILADGRSVRLDQVASVSDGRADPTQAAFLDGRPVIGFQIYRARGIGEVAVADGVEPVLADLVAQHPDLELTKVGGSVDYTVEQYEGSMSMLYEGAILAVLVVWLFLRDWRATLIAATALPLSILPTFAVMQYLGYSLNTLTLLALAATVGILVDDAIVEIENIERHKGPGRSIIEATEEAVKEIAKAVIATTMSLVAVFLPTAMMSGVAGLIFRPFGWTAVIAVLASLVVARLLTPMMAAYFLKNRSTKSHEDTQDGRITRRYLSAVDWCLSHRRTTMLATLALLAGSFALLPLIPAGFLPPDDRSLTELTIELAPGTAIEETIAVAAEVRGALKSMEGVDSVFTVVGQGSGGMGEETPGSVRRASMTLILSERGTRPAKTDIEALIKARVKSVPGARFSVGDAGNGTLSLILSGDGTQILESSARRLVYEMRGVDGLSNVTSSANLDRQEIVIRPDLVRAAELGVTTEAMGEVVRVATSGDFDGELPRLNLDDRQLFIRVMLSEQDRESLDVIGNLRVPGRDGPVPLASVATITIGSGTAQIDRYDRKRNISVTANLDGIEQGEATERVDALPAMLGLPTGVEVISAGGTEIGEELSTGFVTALIAGVLCIYCVLVVLFQDFLQPITILSAIPLSVGGAFVALLLASSSLSMPAMIGMVALMGIVTKNSILLVEYAILSRKTRRLRRREALLDACRKRARPIIMTTVAMIAGMAPIVLGFSADASFRQPMAFAIIGGLVTSTALSLLVIPVVFTLVDDVGRAFSAAFRRDIPLKPHTLKPSAV